MNFEERIADYTLWLTISTGVLALVTFGLVYMAYRQERHFVRTERPYVFFGDAKQEKRGVSGYDFFPVFVNTGKTPAIVTGIRLRIGEAIEPPIPQTAELRRMPQGAYIGANQPWPRGKVALTLAQHQAVVAKTAKVFLYGEIIYTDIFKKERRTWFCRTWNGKQFVLGDLTSEDLNGFT